ncbi:MAG TPA: SEC-C metal-binding domain-containing protein, partial [Pseudoxanthomonas sp.]|nr:SEC-C metal-binding domain-containing protein [Pseudoxanthomonas sp.]
IDEQWDLAGLERELAEEAALELPVSRWPQETEELDAEAIEHRVQDAMAQHFDAKEAAIGAETMRALEKHIMLTVLDKNWKEHLARMDYLRQGIHLRGYAQKQPKQEYKKEAFELFSSMLEQVKREVVTLLARVRIRSEEEVAALEAQERALAEAKARQLSFQHEEAGGYGADEEAAQAQAAAAAAQGGYVQSPPQTVHREGPKVGRNDPCPCGSGKKYKHCHGQLG